MRVWVAAIALGLSGCASSPPVIEYQDQQPQRRPARHRHVVTTPKVIEPELKFTSKEWWARENDRARRYMSICKGC